MINYPIRSRSFKAVNERGKIAVSSAADLDFAFASINFRTGQLSPEPTLRNEAQAPTSEMAVTPPSIRKSAPTTYAESSDAR